MASIKVLLRKEKVNEQGFMPIYIRITKDRKSRFISLGHKVHPKNWDEKKQRVKSRFENAAWLNAFIAKEVAKIEKAAAEVQTKSDIVSSRDIKKKVQGGSELSFISYFQKYLDGMDQVKQYGLHRGRTFVLKKLKDYLKGEDLRFNQLTVNFIKDYMHYLKTKLGNEHNTACNNLKGIRKLCNDAEREEIITAKENPFNSFEFKLEGTEIEHLTDDELALLEKVELEEGSRLFHHRNMYVLTAYAGGLRISDLCLLQWVRYTGTHITLLDTMKTSVPVSILLPKQAKEILEYYKATNPSTEPLDYVFPMLDSKVNYNDATLRQAISKITSSANLDIKTLAKKAKIGKELHFHTSRHTWATRALKKGIPLPLVSKLMGHKSILTTQVYTKIVNTDLDRAMENAFEV